MVCQRLCFIASIRSFVVKYDNFGPCFICDCCNITAQAHCPNVCSTIAIAKSVGPWPVFMAVGKVRTTATAVDKIVK